MNVRIGAAAAAIGLAIAAPALADGHRLELADYMNWENVAGPQISPDGETIIYTRRHVDKMTDRWVSELWQMKADGDRHRFLAKGGNLRWSPGGERIAFTRSVDGKSQIFVRWMDAEGATSQITHETRAVRALGWSPDGEWIAYRAGVPISEGWKIDMPPRPAGAKWADEARVTQRLFFRADRRGFVDEYDHLFIAPADGGSGRQITEGNTWGVNGAIEWTPDGAALLFAGVVDPTGGENISMASDINIVDIATREIRKLNAAPGNWSRPTVSPNGRLVAYLGDESTSPDGPTYPPQQLRIVSIDGSDDRVVVNDLRGGVSDMRWAPDGRGLYLAMSADGTTNVYYVGANGRMRSVTEGEHRFSVSSVSNRGVAAGVLSAPHVTPNVATANLANGRIAQLTDVNADVLAGKTLGEVEEIYYDSFDGARIHGWIVYPPDYDPARRYPLQLSIHGGPHGMYGVNFSFPFQEMAANDYIVLYTNPRGSTGYGADFANAIDDSYPGEFDMGDLMAGVETLVARGVVDEDRLFVEGCSGGGILTSYIVTQTDRFAAAVARCPIVNWISAAGTTDITFGAHDLFRKRFWDDPTSWIDHSAIFHVDRVKTPLLVMVGARDLRTPVPQSEEMYIALKLLGVPTKFISVADEWHGTSRVRPSNMLRTQLYMRKWYEEHSGD